MYVREYLKLRARIRKEFLFMKKSSAFGGFIYRKRIENKLNLREVAGKIGISFVYLRELELGKKTNPNREILEKMITALCLSGDEISHFYDLHGNINKVISQDLPEYIMNNDIVRTALRTARDKPATKNDWNDFIDKLT